MIKKLTIQNFQSHPDSELEFSPGVNVIVGSSDSGKTAIMRALRWLIWNRPTGEAFRSHWGGETNVSIQTKEDVDTGIGGWEITRAKGKENTYKCGPTELKAFGTDVPPQVKELLNITEINLQQQLDSPFLISKSPGEVAAFFNQIAHLEQIDLGLRNIQSDLRKLESTIAYDKERKQTLEQRLDRFDYLTKFESKLEVLERVEGNRIEKVNNQRKLTSIITDLSHINVQIKQTERLTNLEPQVNQLLALYTQLDELKQDRRELRAAVSEVSSLNQELRGLDELIGVAAMVDKLLADQQKLEQLQGDILELQHLLDEIKETTQQIEKVNTTIQKMETKFHEAMPEECPLCGTDLTK